MLATQRILKKELNYITQEKVPNLLEDANGSLFIKKNIYQKLKQFRENII